MQEYWTITAQLQLDGRGRGQGQGQGGTFTARLSHVDGRRLGPLDVRSREQAEQLAERLQVRKWGCTCTCGANSDGYPAVCAIRATCR